MEFKSPSDILTLDDPDPDYLIDRYIYRGQVVVVAGEAGVGKSFLHYTMSMCIAAQLQFFTLPTKPGKVLYFDEENSHLDMHQYLRWIWRGLGQPDTAMLDLNLSLAHFALSALEKQQRFIRMAQVAKVIQPDLIVIDTGSSVCAIENENDNGEAIDAMRNLRIVRAASGKETSMVILKHVLTSHDPKAKLTIRGAKAWLDMCDNVIYHKLTPGRPRSDDLRNSRIFPDKKRAFGLRHEIIIEPEITGTGKQKGIKLIPRGI